MKKALSAGIILLASIFISSSANSQTLKVGVFDIDVMVQAMPGYHTVDSLMQIFDRDTIGALRDYNESEFHRLDSTYKSDSVLVAQGKKPKTILDIVTNERQKAIINVVYFQQIAQNNSNTKRSSLSQNLYTQVVNAYKKVLARKKYSLVLKPNTYEGGFAIDNIFIAVARELKLTDLPENLLYLGNDPDPVKQPQPQTQKPAANKPKN
jgi:Skp family chaperone for outer membrane proteins